jgi:uncharacterized protein YceK
MRAMRLARFLVCLLCIALVSACATVRTLTKYQPGDPVLLSGTRLDVAAISHDQAVLNRLRAKPPAWPWLDLPFSFAADLVFWIIPRTPTPLPGQPGSQ